MPTWTGGTFENESSISGGVQQLPKLTSREFILKQIGDINEIAPRLGSGDGIDQRHINLSQCVGMVIDEKIEPRHKRRQGLAALRFASDAKRFNGSDKQLLCVHSDTTPGSRRRQCARPVYSY